MVDLRQNSDVHERVVAELLTSAGVVADYLEPAGEPAHRGAGGEVASPRLLRSPYGAYGEEAARELTIVDAAARRRRQFHGRGRPTAM